MATNPTPLKGVSRPQNVLAQRFAKIRARNAKPKILNLSRPAKPKAQKPKAKPYNPLAPLAGKPFEGELNAETRSAFRPRFRQQGQAERAEKKQTALVGSGFDQYRAALDAAQQRIDAANTAAQGASQSGIDTAYQHAIASMATPEGRQAAEGARLQGTQAMATLRSQGAADTALYASRSANSVLGKTEALGREGENSRKLAERRSDLETARSDFRTTQRRKLTDAERQYSAVRKEFGLKVKTESDTNAVNKLRVSADKAGANAQKIVARIYASADKAGARAQVRVAKLQLQKGKIDQHQYRRIVNIYKGLPAHGQASQPKGAAAPGASGAGSGTGGQFLPWEKDKIDLAFRSLTSAKADRGEKAAMIGKLVNNNIPARLARIAWQRYINSLGTGLPPGGGNPGR